jgi:3-dehydroquinate dehydratase type I
MSTVNLCGVVMGGNTDDLIRQISLCKNIVEFIELRIDYSNDSNGIDLSLIKKNTTQKIIFTCRRKDEGGKWNGGEEERLHILQNAFNFGFLVDIELRTLEEGKLILTPQMEKNTIISFHDFIKTPTHGELNKIIKRMDVFHPHIKKIATMIQVEEDIKKLYSILIEKKDDEKFCIVGMGELGKQTRIFSPLLGGSITYCSINNEGSAPGQMSCKQMKEIYSLLT